MRREWYSIPSLVGVWAWVRILGWNGMSRASGVKWDVQSIPGWVRGQDRVVEQRWGVHGHREP